MNINIDGLNINYICEGEGELVLLLHGWGSNITLFQAAINLLKQNYKVIAMDMPGFGESDEPSEPWDVDRYVDFVLEFLKGYQFDKITLLGHSFGGRVIIKLCSRDLPFEVEKVILVDSAGVKPEKTTSQKIKQTTYKMTKKIFASAAVQKMFPDALENLRRRNGSADYNAASPIMRQTLVKVVNEDLCDLMPNVKCPTLLIWGKNDDATPLSDGQLMEKLMPEAALVVFDNAGHYSFLEQQVLFSRVLASFMNIPY
ncbi:MAG: alpha/beta hydrolase [Ruminococcus sp.]|nr:alpha/beta hydrolase [Ruminococcus sp.]